MSRRPVVEEVSEDEFDDDTDLPLPKHTLPNTGARGALLEEINIDLEGSTSATTPSASRATSGGGGGGGGGGVSSGLPGTIPQNHPLFKQFANTNSTTSSLAGGGRQIEPNSPEAEQFKKWTCVYPIYMDAKRAYGTGQRKIAREKSVWWPRSIDMANAAHSLGIPILHEPTKCHPRDWENPGRIKVQWKTDGRLTNSSIPTKKRLFEVIAAQLQRTKPSQIPDLSKLSIKDNAPVGPDSQAPPPSLGLGSKIKPPIDNKPTFGDGNLDGDKKATPRRRRKPLPKPPLPFPPLQDRVSMYSPLIASNVLLDGWKVGTEKPPGGEGTAATPGGVGKGKRKVIRIRG